MNGLSGWRRQTGSPWVRHDTVGSRLAAYLRGGGHLARLGSPAATSFPDTLSVSKRPVSAGRGLQFSAVKFHRPHEKLRRLANTAKKAPCSISKQRACCCLNIRTYGTISALTDQLDGKAVAPHLKRGVGFVGPVPDQRQVHRLLW